MKNKLKKLTNLISDFISAAGALIAGYILAVATVLAIFSFIWTANWLWNYFF